MSETKPKAAGIRDPQTKRELPPREQPGYYPGFSTMAQKPHWEEATTKTIEDRLQEKALLKFFTAEEAPLMKALLDRVMPQEDRDEAHQIPLL